MDYKDALRLVKTIGEKDDRVYVFANMNVSVMDVAMYTELPLDVKYVSVHYRRWKNGGETYDVCFVTNEGKINWSFNWGGSCHTMLDREGNLLKKALEELVQEDQAK